MIGSANHQSTAKDGSMDSIPQDRLLGNLPVEELVSEMAAFLEPVLVHLPDERFRKTCLLAVQGIVSGQSPMITRMARGIKRKQSTIWAMSKRIYRFVRSKRFSHRALLKGLYGVAQRTVNRYHPPCLVVALDPVNFEKPYTRKYEGISTILKSTPPGEYGKKRLTSGYPAITAAIVNLPDPVITYANWFSYKTADFVSENRELYRAIRITRALFPKTKLRFVGDSGLDDQKVFAWVKQVHAEFIIRSSHDRRVEVYNDRLDRWENELLSDLVVTVPLSLKVKVTSTKARRRRVVDKQLGWLKIRLLDSQQVLWALVIHDPNTRKDLVLLTNTPIRTDKDARLVLSEWRRRPLIEHTYRFDQEAGLDIEDMRVRTVERMRRVFVLVLLATLFIYQIAHTWPQPALLWIRRLGGKLGLSSDLDGPYVLLAGIRAVLVTQSTLAFAHRHPFPRAPGTYG
jgi:hypothetical protein